LQYSLVLFGGCRCVPALGRLSSKVQACVRGPRLPGLSPQQVLFIIQAHGC
jgi:hypothetical protein